MKKMWHVHTMEYYSAMRKKEILLLVTIRMDFEDIMPSEIRQRRTNAACCHLEWNLKKKSQIIETGKWLPGARGEKW